MSHAWITTIGLAAGIFTTASWVPQVFRSCRRRTARDLSWGYLLMFALGVSLWEAYGILQHDIAIIVANALTVVLVAIVGGVKALEKPEEL
ncbi:MAG: SemiSWEET transporter [Thermoanaerobaculia bacterium]